MQDLMRTPGNQSRPGLAYPLINLHDGGALYGPETLHLYVNNKNGLDLIHGVLANSLSLCPKDLVALC